MNRKVCYGLLIFCFLVSVSVNFIYEIPWLARLMLGGASTLSYLVWFYDLYQRNQRDKLNKKQ